MKSNYIVRARKFMMDFMPYFFGKNCSEGVMESSVRRYNHEKNRHVKYFHGATRRCLCLADYAVKWDYSDEVRLFGGCENEVTNYHFACEHGYDYLFAEITRIEVMGLTFYVMPRVNMLGQMTDEYYPDEHLSKDEYAFIYYVMGLHDLHGANWGFVNGSVKIIDYACYSRA